jgi:hypothetical protein
MKRENDDSRNTERNRNTAATKRKCLRHEYCRDHKREMLRLLKGVMRMNNLERM